MSRDKFSKIGFVLAMAGSAVGLGNAWKFPTMVGNNGGSAFIILYLVLTFAVAFVSFLAELSIGKMGETDLVSSMYKIAPKNKNAWSITGFFMLGSVLIASFYMVVIGWILKYIYLSFGSLPDNVKQADSQFNSLISEDIFGVTLSFSIVFFIVFYVVSKGIKSGIEKLNFWMMPSLFVLLIVMFLYSIFQGDAFLMASKFLFVPDFSKIDNNTVLMALGLAFFSLSMGAGTVPTYGASLPNGTNLVKSTLSIIFINILVGIFMGLIVFTFIFSGDSPDTSQRGPGLIFVSLATLFSKLGVFGNILSTAFFVSLLFAGITSAVSMIEPFAYYLINKFRISRLKSLIMIGVFVYVLGIVCILSFYAPTAENFKIFNKSFFDVLDYLTSNILLPLGALVFSVFIGYFAKLDDVKKLFLGFMSELGFKIWLFLLRFLSPIAILAIMLYQLFGEKI